jgi:molecular chaperone HscB
MLEVHHDGRCWRCAGRTGLSLSCVECHAPQPVGDADLFAVLGLPRRLTIDPAELERRWLEASGTVHPDRHATGDERARQLSLAASAAVNRAHRTLRDPVERGRYWLELHGEALGRDNNQVPPALATLVFDTQETLETLRSAPHDAAARDAARTAHVDIDARLQTLTQELRGRYATWDAGDPGVPAVLAELKRRLSDIAYLATLEADVDEALEA